MEVPYIDMYLAWWLSALKVITSRVPCNPQSLSSYAVALAPTHHQPAHMHHYSVFCHF